MVGMLGVDRSAGVGTPSLAATCPPLSLLHFADSTEDDGAEPCWEATKPPSYLSWSYRDSPWRRSPTDASQSSRCSPSPRSISRQSGRRSATPRDGALRRRPRPSPLASTGSSRPPSRVARASPDALRCSSVASAALTVPSSCRTASPSLHIGDLQATWCSSLDAVSTALPLDSRLQDSFISGGLRELSASLADPESLGAAAEAAGSRARGPVTMAIRAKATMRLAAAQASRQLLHLGGEPRTTGPQPPWVAKPPETSRQRLKRDSSSEFSSTDPGDEVTTIAAYLGTPEPEPPKRCIRVAQHTTLGRMVKRDPERAAKYGLVAVPTWQKNRPWPPPPVPLRKRVGALPSVESREVDPRKDSSVLGDRRTIKNLAGMVNNIKGVRKARARQSTLSRTDLEELAKACQTADRAVREEELDIKEALAMLSRNDIIILVDIFNRFSLGTGGVLTRKNIHNALWAAGVCNVSTVDDQWKLKFVQEEVLNHTRGSVEGGDTSEAPSPIADRNGVWHLEEFVMMMAGLSELERREQHRSHEMLALAVGLDLSEVAELFEIFGEFDEDESGTLSLQELQTLLKRCNIVATPAELKNILGLDSLETAFNFEDFVKCAVHLGRFLVAPSGEDAPDPAPTHSPSAPVSSAVDAAKRAIRRRSGVGTMRTISGLGGSPVRKVRMAVLPEVRR